MKKRELRKQMFKNRVFLHLVQSDDKKNTRQRINVCTNIQANCLLHVLHNISNGEIPVRKEYAEYLRKTRKMPFLNKIREKKAVTTFLKKTRDEKVSFLKKLTALYPKLLALLFDEE